MSVKKSKRKTHFSIDLNLELFPKIQDKFHEIKYSKYNVIENYFRHDVIDSIQLTLQM